MRLTIRHLSTYLYDPPADRVAMRLKLYPSRFEGQSTVEWRVTVNGVVVNPLLTSGFGDEEGLWLDHRRPEEAEIIAEGVVETEDKAGLVRGLPANPPANIFLRETRLTRPDKAIEAMRRLMLAEVDPTMEECFLVLTAIQHDQMMRETQAISLDYMPAPVMQDGMITRFGGFNFVICSDELVPKVGSDRYVYAYCRSAIRFGNWGSGVKSRMDVMPDYNYSTQVHTKASFGAVRAEEGKVVRILCTES